MNWDWMPKIRCAHISCDDNEHGFCDSSQTISIDVDGHCENDCVSPPEEEED